MHEFLVPMTFSTDSVGNCHVMLDTEVLISVRREQVLGSPESFRHGNIPGGDPMSYK